jgi:tetratricopeptide (TPR) repeat protein
VFAAEVGIPYRAAFSAMGDTTNTAARICGKTPQKKIYVHPSVLDHTRTLYESEPVGPFMFKGKTQPQVLYDVGEEIGVRGTVDLDELPLLGRDDELAELTLALAGIGRPDATAGSVVVVQGAVGVGKSRLLNDALRSAPELARLEVHAEPYGSTSAYRVFRDPVRSLLGVQRGAPAEMAAATRAAVQRLAPHLEPFLPLVADVIQVDVPTTPAVQQILPQYRPERTADVMVELLAAARPGPMVVTVEDAHWVDDASRALLARVAAETEVRPWVLVVVRRDEEGGFAPERAEIIDLGTLDADVVRRLAVTATEAAPLRPHELEQVVTRAGGNPLFLLELIRAAQELGSLDAVPTSLQGAMAAQVDALDPFAKRVLSYASVLGRSFRRNALAEVLRAESLRVDAATIERLQRFLEEDGPDRFRFRNGLVCDITYDGLGYNLRARLHKEAGEAIERISTDHGADANVLSLHFSKAGDHERTYTYGRIAAERAARAHANVEAAIQYERVIEAARRLPDVDDADVRSLWTALGEARERAGLFDRALDAYQRALAVPGASPLERAELYLRRAATRERMGKFSLALRESTQAQSMVSSADGLEAARVRARATAFAALMRQRQVRLAEAARLARAAVDQAEASGELAALAGAYRVISVAAHYQGDPEAESYCRRAYDLYCEIGDLIGQGNMAMNLGAFAYFDGRWDSTLDLYRQSSEASRRVGDEVEAASVEANIAEVLISQGQLEQAESLLRNGIRVLRSSGSPWLASFAEMQLGRLLVARGRPEEAEPILRALIAESYEMGVPASAYEVTIHLADALVAMDRHHEALQSLDDAASRTNEDMAVFDGAVALMRARALHATGDDEAALSHVRHGVAVTRQRKLEFDLARLLVLAVELGIAAEFTDDVHGEVRSIVERLGVADALAPAS